jgi:hypothetical protein
MFPVLAGHVRGAACAGDAGRRPRGAAALVRVWEDEIGCSESVSHAAGCVRRGRGRDRILQVKNFTCSIPNNLRRDRRHVCYRIVTSPSGPGYKLLKIIYLRKRNSCYCRGTILPTWEGGDGGPRARVGDRVPETSCETHPTYCSIVLTDSVLRSQLGDDQRSLWSVGPSGSGTDERFPNPYRSLRHRAGSVAEAGRAGRGRHRICMALGHIIAGDRESGGS